MAESENGIIDWENINTFHQNMLDEYYGGTLQVKVNVYSQATKFVDSFILKGDFPRSNGRKSVSSNGVTLVCETTDYWRSANGVRYQWMEQYDYSIRRGLNAWLEIGDYGIKTDGLSAKSNCSKITQRLRKYRGVDYLGTLVMDSNNNSAASTNQGYYELNKPSAIVYMANGLGVATFSAWLTGDAVWGSSQTESYVPNYNIENPVFRVNMEYDFAQWEVTLYKDFTNRLFITNNSRPTLVKRPYTNGIIIDAGPLKDQKDD